MYSPNSIPLERYRDTDYGLLLPSALTFAALGTNDYHIRKLRPHLIEGDDYLRLRGEDHIDRLFYSLSGLQKLCHLLPSTPQIQQFYESLQRFAAPPGALAPRFPEGMVQSPNAPLMARNPTSAIDTSIPVDRVGSPLAHPGVQEHHDAQLADLLLRQQTLSLQTVQTASDLILNAQRQADQLRPNLHIEQTEHRIEHWLNRQDSLSLTLIIVGLFCSLSLGTFIIAHLVTQPPAPAEVQHGH